MTGRRQPGLGGYLPAALTVAALIVVARLLIALLPLLLVGLVVFACWRWRVHRRARAALTGPPTLRGRVFADEVELGRLRDENDQLRADLTDAQASAHAAWDAAASVPPRPAAHTTARDRLLAGQLGGVHDLFRSEK